MIHRRFPPVTFVYPATSQVKPLTKIAIAANADKDGAREIVESIERIACAAGAEVALAYIN